MLTERNAVVPAPGLGERDKIVKSKSGSTPHLVSVKGLKYECDDKCLHFKSIKLCSHTVAAAEINNELKEFVKTKRSCDSPNLMQLGTHGMPAGAGRKGGKLPKKKTTKRGAPSDENRVTLNTTTNCQPQPSNTVVPPVHYPRCMSQSPMYSDNQFRPSSSWGLQSPSEWQQSQHTGYPPLTLPPPPSWAPSPPPSWTPPSPSWTPPPPLWTPPPPSWTPPPPSWTPPPPPSWASNSNFTSPSNAGDDPYKVCFKHGNISVCNGCRNNFTKADIVVIQHAEFRQYTNPHSGMPASKFGNAYYHMKRMCIELKTGMEFDVKKIVVPDDVKQRLTASQKQCLFEEFRVPL